MDGKRHQVPFTEVTSGRMRFAPVKDKVIKESAPKAKKGKPNNNEKSGWLRFKLGQTSPETAIQFCKESTGGGKDQSWPEVTKHVRENEKSKNRPLAGPAIAAKTLLGPSSSTHRFKSSASATTTVEESTSSSSFMETVIMAPYSPRMSEGDDNSHMSSNNYYEKSDDDNENDDNDHNLDADNWFDVFAESPTQKSDSIAKLYGIELHRLDALVPLNETYTEFVIPDFNSDWKSVALLPSIDSNYDLTRLAFEVMAAGELFLCEEPNIDSFEGQTNRYIIVTRKEVRLITADASNTSRWIYCCSCNETQQDFVKNLNFSLLCSEEELAALEIACIHTKAVSYCCRVLDSKQETTTTQFSTEEEEQLNEDSIQIIDLPHDSTRVCICAEGKPGVVGIDMGKLKCITCKYNFNNCIHVETLRSSTSSSSSEIPNIAYDFFEKERVPWQPSSFTLLKPVSDKKIPVKLQNDVASKLAVGYANFVKKEGDIFILPNESDSCQNCGCPLDCEGIGSSLLLYTKLSPLKCKVYIKECPACNFVNAYDGSNDGILNMGRFLIGHDVLRDYMYHFMFGGREDHLYMEERAALLSKSAFESVAEKQKTEDDHVRNYGLQIINLTVMLLQLKDTAAEGDGNRAAINEKLLLSFFKANNSYSKYALEMLLSIAQKEILLSERMAKQIKWGKFVNWKGGRGKNIENDLAQEICIRLAKDLIKSMGASKTEKAISLLTNALTGIRDILTNFDTCSDVAESSTHHTRSGEKDDELKMIKDLLKIRPFFVIPGRKHESFPDIKANPKEKLNMGEFNKWIKKHLKQLKRV